MKSNNRRAKSYSVLEVLNFSDVALIFEFYSTKNSDFLVEGLSKVTSKNVILTNELTYYPTYINSILIKEYEASKARYQYHLAPQNYHSILPLIESITEWMKESVETTYDTKLKISLSFNHRHLQTLSTISTMNPAKLVLKFDEDYVFSRLPEQVGSPYTLSIKSMAPVNSYLNENRLEQNINLIVSTPQAEYYGIDFSKYAQGILECNYIGGKGYEKKTQEIKEILQYFILKSYQSLNEEEYDDFELFELKRITKNFDKMQAAYNDPNIFLTEFQNIKVCVDLKYSEQTLKTFWQTIRKPIFEMIINGGLQKGTVNYDADQGVFQLKDGTIGRTILKGIEFINCELHGVMENCSFVGCDIRNSRIYNSKFVKNNKITSSYLQGASINAQNEVLKCYIVNNEEVINCKIFESVVKFATPGRDVILDENSTVIVKELPLPKKSDQVQVEEIRDYMWIKSMRKSQDQGFQNAYDRNKYLGNIKYEED